MYGEPIRRVVIGPYYAYKQAELYPDLIPHWRLTYQDVYDSNIYMAGLQAKLMDNILQNANHVHYLIILDRSACNAPFVGGKNIVRIYTVSDLKDLQGVSNKRIISYSPDTLNIPFIEDFDNNTNEDKIKKYSTMPIMRTLIDYLERR